MARKRKSRQYQKDNTGATNSLPIAKAIPNIVTLAALCLGLSSLRFAINGHFAIAASLILVACFLDGVDGRIARVLGATSNFGAQLDSFADFFNFGIAPIMLLYLWVMRLAPIKGLGWAAVMFFAICAVLRLARFNCTENNKNKPPFQEYFFVGMPAPCGAGIAMLPFIISLEFGQSFLTAPITVIFYAILIGLMMASTVPTFSIKKMRVSAKHMSALLIGSGSLVIGLIIQPWLTLIMAGVFYISTIPVAVFSYRFYEKRHNLNS